MPFLLRHLRYKITSVRFRLFFLPIMSAVQANGAFPQSIWRHAIQHIRQKENFNLDISLCTHHVTECAYLLKPVSAVTPSITKELQPKVRC